MRSEYLDKKVQEAAEKHHPAYDEKAWQKMEKLLNEHLPVQKDNERRRILLLLFFFLLVGGGAFVLISRPWDKDSNIAARSTINNEKVLNKGDAASNNKSANGDHSGNSNAVEANKPASKDAAMEITQFERMTPQEKKDGQVITLAQTRQGNRGNDHKVDKNGVDKKAVSVNSDESTSAAAPTKDTKPDQSSIDRKSAANDKQTLASTPDVKPTEPISKDEISKTENVKARTIQQEATKPPIHKEKSSRRSGFALLLSAGPDVSKAGNSELGKLTLDYGAGISYTKNRFTFRTGVYGARKIYKAGASDYTLRYQPPPNIKFESAAANCYVIEIPVSMLYNFGFTNKGNWFGGAGVSSYLMKSEKYNYQYKVVSTGNSFYYPTEYKNANKHYFSVVDLSAGYNFRLNNTLSISAEPYVKIPLTGIGEGKVDLKGGGILFTLGIKPFRK